MNFTKTLIAFTVFVLLLSVLAACRKEKEIENSGIIGNWLLVEIYDGYVNGGSFKWNKVSYQDSHTLSFTPDGKYIDTPNGSGNGPVCQGSFEYNYSDVTITTNCEVNPVTLNISELEPTTLIINRQGIEGPSRYKYKAVK